MFKTLGENSTGPRWINIYGVCIHSYHRGEVEIVCFQGEQNKQLQRNLNAVHVNFFPQSHVSVEIIVRLLIKDSRLAPDDLIIVCVQKQEAQRRTGTFCTFSATVSSH